MRDPITEAIFGDSEEGGVFIREDEVDALTEAIFARLDSSTPVKPAPSLAKAELTRESILREIEGLDDSEMAALEARFISRPLPKRIEPHKIVLANASKEILAGRAENDWFQIPSAEKPTTPSFKIERPKRRRIIFPVILLGFLILGGTLAVTRGVNPKLQGASFALLNAEQDLVFAPVARLSADLRNLSQNLITKAKEEPDRKKEFLAAAEEAEKIQEILDEFFEANRNFSWLNIFRSSPASPQAVSRFEEALSRAEKLELKTEELRPYLGWLRFWEQLLTRNGRYLVLSDLSADRQDSDWMVLEISAGKTRIHSTGRLSELNAAVTTKLVPPKAVQVSKTNFDFYETDWFGDSRTQSEVITRLFSATTQTDVDGVVMISDEVVGELGTGLELANVFSFLERTADWRGLERVFKNALETHNLNLFFRDSELQSFVEKENLAQVLKLSPAEDGLSLNLLSWRGEFNIGEVLYRPEFFVDGSIVSKLSVAVKNIGSGPGSAYLKLYLPFESDMLDSNGFAPSRRPPQFDYEGEGFESLKEIFEVSGDSSGFPRLDFYKEGDFLAVGGWVQLQPGRSVNATLEYRLPFRLDWRGASDTYKLKVLKPGDIKELNFIFETPPSEEVGFELTEPQGTLIGLKEDLLLEARLNFVK